MEKDPANVGFDEHHRLVEGEGGQGPRGGLADAGKGAEGLNRVGEASVKLRHQSPGDALQGQGAAIVPQSLPGGHDVPQGGPGQGQNVGEGIDKGFILEGHAFHLGLLQHDFGNEDVIGVSGGPPGQLPPLVMKKPVEAPAKSVGGGGSDPARLEPFGKWFHAKLSPVRLIPCGGPAPTEPGTL